MTSLANTSNSNRPHPATPWIKAHLMLIILIFTSLTSTTGQEFEQFGQPLEGFQQEKLTLTATFKVFKGTNRGELSVTAMIAQDWYIYSLTQPKGGPIRTTIQLREPDQLKSIGTFKPNIQPKITTQPEAFGDLRIEKHIEAVTFTAPVEFKEGSNPKKLKIKLKYRGQVCKKTCDLVNQKLTAGFAGYEAPQVIPKGFKPQKSHVLFSGKVSAAEKDGKIKAGGKIKLQISATGLDDYHVYAYSDKVSDDPSVNPTLVSFTSLNGWKVSQPSASSKPVARMMADKEVSYHPETVTWTFEIEIPNTVKPDTYNLAGVIGFQTCTDEQCDSPDGVLFNVDVAVDRDATGGDVNFRDDANYFDVYKLKTGGGHDSRSTDKEPSPHANTDGRTLPWEPFTEELLSKYAFVTDETGNQVPFDINNHKRSNQTVTTNSFSMVSMLQAMFFGFLGGLILNIMPCVLPVIGLKIMSFVQQGGEKKSKAFALNLSYSFGIIFVFLVLATLGVFAGVTWGKQFQNQTFNIVLSCVVFVFALSLIGVWEIPIPGFVGSEKANKLAEKEGFSGAFFKGILTTLLATPCTGPFIVPVLSWAFGQHPVVIYAVFVAMGIGMASPFLIIGANPKLVSFLPKPGAWMGTFKHVMGFVLLGTVIWIMRNVKYEDLLPVFTLLFGLWLGCWWIGSMQFGANLRQKLVRWVIALVMVGVCGYLAFGIIGHESRSRFASTYQVRTQSVAERPPGKYTLLVDFTAVW